MTFEEKAFKILVHLTTKHDKIHDLDSLLSELEIEHLNSAKKEFVEYFKKTGFAKISRFSSGRYGLILTEKGADWVNSFEDRDKERNRDEKMKEYEFTELSIRLGTIDKQLKEQSEFRRSTINTNRNQKYFTWVALGISIFSLLFSMCK